VRSRNDGVHPIFLGKSCVVIGRENVLGKPKPQGATPFSKFSLPRKNHKGVSIGHGSRCRGGRSQIRGLPDSERTGTEGKAGSEEIALVLGGNAEGSPLPLQVHPKLIRWPNCHKEGKKAGLIVNGIIHIPCEEFSIQVDLFGARDD
jgi:hypothetical protein